MSDFISWDANYDVGIQHVDKQHKHLVDLMNELYKACTSSGKEEVDEKFKDVMKEMVEYVLVHFKDEEKIMESINYPKLKEHKQKHEFFIKEVLASVSAYTKGKQFVPNTFVRFLRDWLFNHILIDDKEMSRYYFSVKG
ncbi:bacteriohemerythrin [Treponema pedis]|uniref:Hemerythrin-like protein n=2 Tax=Treponema pedis TaxID=409322 RepID=S6A4A7_9SPIR|nr:bacteriohemerythrin [Treponema pedis]AGT44276.1 hemerythrin-like protein [Treponema pedis str. T A4]QOW62041.1 hemerythrin family protein [Treponema pedis]QSI04983.1 hemerythrin [Treponema pedis]